MLDVEVTDTRYIPRYIYSNTARAELDSCFKTIPLAILRALDFTQLCKNGFSVINQKVIFPVAFYRDYVLKVST